MKRSHIVAAALVSATLCGIAAPTAVHARESQADPTFAQERTPVAVGLGDSFMSGEGGRLAGNTYDRLKADGVYSTGKQDRGWQTYRDSRNNPVNGKFSEQDTPAACHRSDTSVVNTLAGAMNWKGINLACSGATTHQVVLEKFRNELPQVQQLAAVASDPSVDVKAVVISIGGNDMGFSDVLTSCLQILQKHDCSANKNSTLSGDIDATKRLGTSREATMFKITQTLDSVTEVMRSNGYADGSYRFIYDGAPKLFADAPDRYAAKDGYLQSRFRESPGVPFHDRTVAWSNSVAVPLLNELMREAARSSENKQIQFLDLSNAFKGHELSSRATKQYRDRKVEPKAEDSEWVVPLDPHYIAHRNGSPRLQESFHPNAFGQQAIGQCVTELVQTPSSAGDFSCVGVPGQFAAGLVTSTR